MAGWRAKERRRWGKTSLPERGSITCCVGYPQQVEGASFGKMDAVQGRLR